VAAPVPLTRYAAVALLGLGIVLLAVFLVRPFIFTFSEARDDANYAIASASQVDNAGALLIEVVLEEAHGLPGAEAVEEDRLKLRVVAARVPGQGTYSVVNAWSPSNHCPLSIAEDRLVDCDGDTWTYQGVPFEAGGPFIIAFPNEVRQGAIMVDFTRTLESNP
jgi:hypothetical protein